MLLATLRDLAKTLRCTTEQAEDVVRDERSARASFDRRGLFRAAGAVAGGLLVSVPTPSRAEVMRQIINERVAYWVDQGIIVGRIDVITITFQFEGAPFALKTGES